MKNSLLGVKLFFIGLFMAATNIQIYAALRNPEMERQLDSIKSYASNNYLLALKILASLVVLVLIVLIFKRFCKGDSVSHMHVGDHKHNK